ncbi:hypothetical protein RSJ42_11460 [Methanosarcina hadiensis]|uniref:hypothetical protein n=1 Tax=Methanosarcina hadiensis TaxID=3078083 RepID=UPI0039774DA9
MGNHKIIVIDDSILDEPIYSPVCTFCAHHHRGRKDHTCTAFSDTIPDEIWRGDNDHKKPYPGDHGIQFEHV